MKRRGEGGVEGRNKDQRAGKRGMNKEKRQGGGIRQGRKRKGWKGGGKLS